MSSQSDNRYPGLLPDRGLLNDFELKVLPADYRQYYKSRKQNFFAIVERFPKLWDFYQSLDSILLNEFSDVESVTEENKMFPLALFFNAHAKIRLSIELAFSGCLPEAQSLMRDAIEFVAHAHIMVGDIDLQKIWLSKN